jgi:hypothetical protein
MSGQEKRWCGSAKEKQTRDYPPFYSVTLNLSELGNAVRAGYGWKDNDGNQMIKINLMQRREPSRSGSTHYAIVDTWRPDDQKGGGQRGYVAQEQQFNEYGTPGSPESYNTGPVRPPHGNQPRQGGDYQTPHNGYNQNGDIAAPQQGGPQGQPRPQGYDSRQNQRGYESYTPPKRSEQNYEDDIPF